MRKISLILTALYLTCAAAPPSHAIQSSVRERLGNAAMVSRELSRRSTPLEERTFRMLQATLPEDASSLARNRFPRLAAYKAYAKVRPWVAPSWTREVYSMNQLLVVAPDWPHMEDAEALRALLNDQDSAIRSLAIEALSALRLPEDINRIHAFITDRAPGASVLAPVFTMSAQGIQGPETDEGVLAFRVWSERTVGDYAWVALRLITGHRFDGTDAGGMTFDDWWKKNNLGRESLWYWQGRLVSEYRAFPPEQQPAEITTESIRRREQQTNIYRAALHQTTLNDLRALSTDAQAKVFLATVLPGYPETSPIGPVNELFPDGLQLSLGRDRVLELLEGRNVWPEVQDLPEARGLMSSRLARLAPEILPREDWARVRRSLETWTPEKRMMPVFYSRLLPPAGAGNADDPQTREGYLRAALANATEGYARERVAAEMVRSNLDGQWPALSAVFYTESRRDSSDARLGVLNALGEAPHTRNKLAVLVGLVNDPRNETILTQPNQRMGMDGYRQQAVRSLNAISGNEYVSYNVLQDLGIPSKSASALVELRRLANALLARSDGR